MKRRLYVVQGFGPEGQRFMRPRKEGERATWGPFQAAMVFFSEHQVAVVAEKVGGKVVNAVMELER